MSNSGQLPGVDRLTEIYFDAWENFAEEKFTPEELRNELLKESTEPDNVPDESAIYSSLYRAATIGLVLFHGDKTFNIQITPEDPEEKRHEIVTKHMDRLWEKVEQEEEKRIEESDDTDQKSILTHNSESYVRTFVGRKTDIKENLEGYFQAAYNPEEHAGVVLESWTTVADAADDLARKLTDNEKTSEIGLLYRFDKSEEEVTIDEEGEKVIRIYLKETRFS